MSAAQPQVRWLAKGQHGAVADWAGGGIGAVLLFDQQRPGFGDEGPENRGPAALVKFSVEKSRGRSLPFEAWIPINELDTIEEAAA